MRICFVCLGNICRSPTAEAVMRSLVAEQGLDLDLELDSAGTGGWHAGELADPRTRAAAAKRGLAMPHRARQLTRADLGKWDLVIVMDRANAASVRAIGFADEQVHLLRSFDPTADDHEVPDPYSGGAAGFEAVLDQCERACAGLLAHVRVKIA